ncbi:UNVERIFIED_CONTAM: hypothetical protein HDU68_010206 [Siphonaria sp. JEL0065]|nr:hypothetical protein HDU68_010206 [Siphonaria sp. JEL0065]
MTTTLDALFASSTSLTAHIVSNSNANANANAGDVARGLSAISAATAKLKQQRDPVNANNNYNNLNNNLNNNQGFDAATAVLLANRSFDVNALNRNIASLDALDAAAAVTTSTSQTTASTWQTSSNLSIEAFLFDANQAAITAAIDAQKTQTVKDCRRRFDDRLSKDWDARRKRLFSAFSDSSSLNHKKRFASSSTTATAPIGTPSTPSSTLNASSNNYNNVNSNSALQMLSKHKAYAQTVSTLIHAQANNHTVDAFALFASTAEKLDRSFSSSGGGATATSSSAHLAKCWLLLQNMFGGDVGENGFGGDGGRSDLSGSLSPVGGGLVGGSGLNADFTKVYRGVGSGVASDLSNEAVLFRRRVVGGGKKFLQDLYYTFIHHIIHLNRIQVGGMPTCHTYIDAYIHLKFTKNNSWNSGSNLEIHHGVAVWAHVWYLVRCGFGNEAVEFVGRAENEAIFGKIGNGSQKFVGWVQEFVERDGKLSLKTRNEVLEEWGARIRPYLNEWSAPASAITKLDPFKVSLLKVLGRCDMASKVVKSPDVAPSVEDYLWVQLMLVYEDTSDERRDNQNVSLNLQDRYTLRDMSRNMQNFGPVHFNKENRTPHVYFLVLLLCGEFERAVAFLYTCSSTSTSNDIQSGGTSLDAIHFAIALASHGLLRVPENPRGFDGGSAADVLVVSTASSSSGGAGANDSTAYFLLAKVLYGYSKLFFKTDPTDALSYLVVLGKYGVSLGNALEDVEEDGDQAMKEGGSVEQQAGKDYSRLVYTYIKELVLESIKSSGSSNKTKNALLLLGEGASTRDVRVPGQLERLAGLIHLSSFKDLVARVLVPAARDAEQRGRLGDAVALYEVAEKYDVVVEILAKQLSDAFVSGAAALAGSSGVQAGGGNGQNLSSLYNTSLYKPSPGAMTGSGVSLFGPSTPSKSFGGSSSIGVGNASVSGGAVLAIVAQSQHTLETFSRRPYLLSQIPAQTQKSLKTLLALHQFLAQITNGNANPYETLKNLVASTNQGSQQLLPPSSSTDPNALLRLSQEFSKLPDIVAKCVPGLLVLAMESLVKVYNGGGGDKKAECKQWGRNVLLYAGNIQYRIPSDVFAKLNRWEVLMS